MGKRSNFLRLPRDLYESPKSVTLPLLPFLPKGVTYYEPCAGSGALIKHLEGHAVCVGASDIEPLGEGIVNKDALLLTREDVKGADIILTNPPWGRDLLHPMILHFINLKPTLLLFDSDWLFTKQSIPFLPYLTDVVAVGRVKWIPGSKMTGKDNAAWYRFFKWNSSPAKFHGRTI